MANVAHFATSPPCPLASFATPSPSPKKSLSLLSFSPTRRKNYLRRKLLKTLKEPYYPTPLIPETPLTNPVIPIEPPRGEQLDNLSDQIACEEVKVGTAGPARAFTNLNFSTSSVVKFGLYLVGAFVFQTICAVWVFGSASSGSISEDKTRVLDLDGDGYNGEKLKLGKGGGFFNVDEAELGSRILEIQTMARDARERESDSKVNDLYDDDEVVKTEIEKEVESKLIRLRKRLQKQPGKSPNFPLNYSRKDGKVEGDNLDKMGGNEALVFRKKYKFRSPSANLFDKPKEFKGFGDHSITKKRIHHSANELTVNGSVDNESVNLLDRGHQPDNYKDKLKDSVSLSFGEDNERKPLKDNSGPHQIPKKKSGKRGSNTKLGRENRAAKPSGLGTPQETSCERPLINAVKPGQSSMTDASNSRSLTKEVHNPVSDEPNALMGNGSLKSSEVRNRQTAGKVEGKHSNDKDDFWWLSLPYVLAIFMCRGDNGEGPKGLFTLKSTPYEMDDGEMSHTVAFEDRGDATNFCYLLQSFFEDLGDFRAEIVPLSIEELSEAVRSHSMKVIVVKKGQIKLYAGQPLPEVELALRSIVK